MSTRILIVDDEPAIADTLAYALRTEGFTAECVSLGREALAILRDGDFALVILDVGLPDLNGFDVCRELRRVSDVPVVFLTARSDEVDRVVGLELGADDYVPKPFSPREVVSRVRAILRRARPPLAPAATLPTVPFVVDKDGARISYVGNWLALTRYEFRMLATLLEHPGRVFSRSRLMEIAWSDTEETLVDTANLLAEIAADELAAGTIAKGRFAAAVGKALRREPNALIWDVSKKSVDARVYVTDAKGIVVFDSAAKAEGADYSQWRDVARVLRGDYGARSSREDPDDLQSSSMYVAAPVLQHGKLIGVLSVSKPVITLMPYAERARDHVMRAGILLLAISALIGIGFTLWLTWSLNRLRDYALAVAEGKRAAPPVAGGRQLSVLAKSLALMREKLDGKQYVEHYVQSLTHELKSPLTAVRGAAELLQESPSAEDGQRFARNIGEQAERMQRIIERLLDLVRVEQLQNPEERRRIVLAELADAVARNRAERLASRQLSLRVEGETSATVDGDPFLLQQALGNLIDNAIEFSPQGGEIVVTVTSGPDQIAIGVSDQGQGTPDYALAHMFERFYSLPRPATGRKSTGLGLAFVREVARLHGGSADFANRPEGGALVRIRLPR